MCVPKTRRLLLLLAQRQLPFSTVTLLWSQGCDRAAQDAPSLVASYEGKRACSNRGGCPLFLTEMNLGKGQKRRFAEEQGLGCNGRQGLSGLSAVVPVGDRGRGGSARTLAGEAGQVGQVGGGRSWDFFSSQSRLSWTLQLGPGRLGCSGRRRGTTFKNWGSREGSVVPH